VGGSGLASSVNIKGFVMQWLMFAVITVVCYALFDFCVKLTAGKLDDGLAGLIFNTVAMGVMLVYVLIEHWRGTDQFVTRNGLITAIGGGVFVGLASITFIKLFSVGANLSVGVTIVRVGMVVLGVTLASCSCANQ
jgi:uncharacterized membrane protein